MRATYRGPMEPAYPCRVMPTRHCPAIFEHIQHGVPVGGCKAEEPCARYESEEEWPWLVELNDFLMDMVRRPEGAKENPARRAKPGGV